MTALTHFLCSTCLAWVVAAVHPAQPLEMVSVQASGRVKPVVRRVRTRAEGEAKSQTSTFSGMLRSDRYGYHRGMNCSSGHGGDTIDSKMGMQLADCQKSCAHDDECTCVNFETESGKCGKQRYCHLEECVPSSLVDTYTLHSTFKVKVQRGNLSSEKPEGAGLSESVPQAAFERSGGRVCTNATELDTTSSVVADLSVTQCLSRCQQNPACTCVRYERYYQSECFLMSACPLPTFCARTNRYDTYVLTTTSAPTNAPTPAPTNAPTTLSPTMAPTTLAPTNAPTTLAPTTLAPTNAPTTLAPTNAPTTLAPTNAPTTLAPTNAPTTLAPTNAPTTLAPTNAPTLAPTNAPTMAPTQPSLAGQYEVWYNGGKRTTNMVAGCDNSVTQPGIFTDRLHFDNVASKCSQSRDAQATMYVEKTHGASKYECLRVSGTTIIGNHYTGPNAFWGTIEYRLISKASCDTYTETVGDCRDSSGGHSNYATTTGTLASCKQRCNLDSKCDSFDATASITNGGSTTCWLFDGTSRNHTGNGVSSSKCFVKALVQAYRETAGDCRDPSGAHSNYVTVSGNLAFCKNSCTADAKCDSFDAAASITSGGATTCWLFDGRTRNHTGNGYAPSKCFVKMHAYAGEYEVWYNGGKRTTNMIIGCDSSASQPGIFVDRLHFDSVPSKCSQSRDSQATLYIEKTHGASKYECLYKSGTTIMGSHYTSPNAFWGTIEYRMITSMDCVNP